MILISTPLKQFSVIVVLGSIILTACKGGGPDQTALLKLTQTAVAATQTAISEPVSVTSTAMPVTPAPTSSPSAPIGETLPPSAGACDTGSVPSSAFWVYQDASFTKNHFVPSGYMGDVGDVTINQAYKDNPCSGDTSIRIVYQPKGIGPNACEYSPPCKWAGVYWLEPANNWGKDVAWKDKGHDLTGYVRLVFWARAERNSQIEFKTGGVVGPYGDSLVYPRATLADLTPEWQQFTIDLEGADLSYIVGGFVFDTNWDTNPDDITFYLDNVRFEK